MDLIDRQAAIDALWKISHEHDSVYYTSAIYTAVDAIEELPSAQPDNSCGGCRYENADDGVLVPCGFCKRSHSDNYERRTDELD